MTVAVPISKSERSLAPDIARGFMLLFIALANVSLYTWGRGVDEYGFQDERSGLDSALLFVEQLLVHDRSRPMFAILYGFGLAMIASRLIARGGSDRDATRLIRRRSFWLIALGAAHSVLLFAGDILAPYGVTGLVVAAMVGRDTAWLKKAAWISGAYVVLVGAPLYAVVSTGMLESVASDGTSPQFGESYVAAMGIGLAGTLATSALAGIFAFFVPLTIVGMLIFRAGWLTEPGKHLQSLTRMAATGIEVGIVSAVPVALISLGVWQPPAAVHGLAVWVTIVGGMMGGLGYVALFACLGHRWRNRRDNVAVRALSALGQRSLSGYLTQSIIMAPLLSAWGFALGDGLGYAAAFGIAAGTWLTTVLLALWADYRGWRGPFEVLLRRLTYRVNTAAPAPGELTPAR